MCLRRLLGVSDPLGPGDPVTGQNFPLLLLFPGVSGCSQVTLCFRWQPALLPSFWPVADIPEDSSSAWFSMDLRTFCFPGQGVLHNLVCGCHSLPVTDPVSGAYRFKKGGLAPSWTLSPRVDSRMVRHNRQHLGLLSEAQT